MDDPYKYFKIEAEELLTDLTRTLLELEKQPSDQKLFNELFRYVHTLKGASNVVKLSKTSLLSHKAEDILVSLREKKQQITSNEITLLLNCFSTINAIVTALKANESEERIDTKKIIDKLDKYATTNMQDSTPNTRLFNRLESRPCEPAQRAVDVPEPPAIDRRHTQSPPEEIIRIKQADMDIIMNLSNEILINHLRLTTALDQIKDISYRIPKNLIHHKELEKTLTDLEHGLEQTHTFTQEINDIITNTRLVRIKDYAYIFKKVIRDLALETQKEVDFSIEGEALSLDRALLEKIKEPIHHMLRNSIVHGIETTPERKAAQKKTPGTITLRFSKQGDIVQIECEDNGRGLDPEALKQRAIRQKLASPEIVSEMTDTDTLNLILLPGFSSSKMITELSGRGVGLDVVKECVSALRGRIHISSEKNIFTRITLSLPFSFNLMDVFMVLSANQYLLLPLKNVTEIRLIDGRDITTKSGKKVIPYNASPIPLLWLSDILGLPEEHHRNGTLKAVILQGNLETIALVVDAFEGKKTVIVKPLDAYIKAHKFASSAAILENGDPAFILSIEEIFNRIQNVTEKESAAAPEDHVLQIIVVDDSLTTRTLISGILNSAGYSVQLATSGEDALELLRNDTFDLALIDIEMPGIDGFELTQRIRQTPKDKDMPIIILSSLASTADKRRGIEVGADAYIVKSAFEQKAFLEIVEKFI